MANGSRFPQLALPFALVGASAGWLSAGLLANPLVGALRPGRQHLAALCAMAFAAATGALITRWCVGKRYSYELDTPDTGARARSDRWPRHVAAVLAAGVASGVAVALLCDAWGGPKAGAISGFFCAIAFVPVCMAVIGSARRAQRARLGSIVAGSDRRAVWGILAVTLAVATLEAVPDWAAAAVGDALSPWPALWMVWAAGLVTGGILIADVGALRQAQRATAGGLEQRDAAEMEMEAEDAGVPRLDLGLGEDLLARFARSASAYRGRDRTLALVQGSPEHALAALRRAVRRGTIALAVIGAVHVGHAAADTQLAQRIYAEQLGRS
jgi:hypothetical protein